MLCLALQGCKESEEGSVAETFSKSSLDGGCTPSASLIDSLLVVRSDSDNLYSVQHNACTSVTSNIWITNDGVRKTSSSLNHNYVKSGEYAIEAIAYKRTFKVADTMRKVIVKSCDAGADCKDINSSDFANLDESISIQFAEAGAAASSGLVYNVTDSNGNVSELSSNIFSASAEGVYEISTEVNNQTFSKNIEVRNVPSCDLKNLMLSGPSESRLNESSYAKVNIPSCLSSLISSIQWNFSDGQSNSYSQSTLFSFTLPGLQSYSVSLNLNNGTAPIVLSRDILVSSEDCVDCPILAEDGTNPDRLPASDPPFGSSCDGLTDGQIVSIGQIVSSEVVSCNEGQGSKVMTYVSNENRLCSSGTLINSENGERTLLSEGACHEWVKTGSTQCSAACGGSQSDLYSCMALDNVASNGNNSLCGAAPSSEAYVCDGDPDFEEIKITEILEQGEPTVCHSNRTGYVIDKEVTTETYRCVEHVITLVDTVTTVEEAPFCLDLKRCNNDSLSPSKAHGRLNWMNMCAAEQPKIQNFFDITADYEDAPQNSYTVNNDQIVGRPTYVTFRNEDGSVWVAPAPGTTNWRNKSAGNSNADGLSCEIPASADIVGICLSSCVTPNQIIASGNGAALPIKRAYDSILGNVQTLAPFSTILRPILMSTPVKQFITEVDDSEHDIMIFTMASGNSIEYTPNHPVVTADGNLKDAENFVIGQSFVKKDGNLDEIVKIENIKYFGKVYNVYMQSSVLERNVVVINDYLTGSAYFQNEGHDFVDRQVLRSSLAK